MVRLKKKLICILSVLTALFLVLGLTATTRTLANEEASKIYVSAEYDGYVSSDATYTVNDKTTLSITFDLPYVLNAGSSYVGFGIVKESEMSDTFIDEQNAESGYAVLFNSNTYTTGIDGAIVKDEDFSKTDFLKSGYTYKATFDNGSGVFALERKVSGSNLFTIVQKVENVKTLVDDEYSIALMFSEGMEFVLEGLTFTEEEKVLTVDDALDYGEGVTLTDGGAYSVFDTVGMANYVNQTAISSAKITNGQIVVAVETSLFENDGGEIGFSIGTEKSGNIAFGGENGVFFALGDYQGVKKYTDGSFSSSELLDGYIDAGSVFSSGRSVKAIFDVENGTFTILARFSEGAAFLQVFKAENLVFPKDAVFAGLQINGDVYLKTSAVSVYVPRAIDDYMTCDSPEEMKYSQSMLSKTESNGRTTMVLSQPSKDSAPSTFMFTEDPITVADGESVVMLIENIKYTMASPSYYAKTSFTFANSNTFANVEKYMYMYSYNDNFSVFYNLNRSEYFARNESLDVKSVNVSLGQSITFYDLFEDGNSLMAVYSPKHQSYSLYMKSAAEPDYTLWQTVAAPDGYDIVNNELYVGFELYGGMILEYDNLKVYTAKDQDIGVAPTTDTAYVGDTDEYLSGGFNLSASKDEYIVFDAVDAGSCDAIAIEYAVERFSYSQGLYSLGFLITDGNVLPNDPPLYDWAKDEYVTEDDGKFVENTKSQFYSFIQSNSLTETANDKARNYLFHAGYTVRVVFSLTDRTFTIQYKTADGYCFNDVATYGKLPEYVDGDNVTVAIRIENTTKIALSSMFAYTFEQANEVNDYYVEGGDSKDIGNAAMYTVKVETESAVGGTVCVDEEEVTAAYKVAGETVTLYAIPNEQYVFTGWYLNGVLVSNQAEFDVDVEGNATYIGKFATASKITVNNGYSDKKSTVTNFYQDGKYLGVNPESVQGYKFIGWTIRYVETTDDDQTIVAEYYLGLEQTDGANMLADVEGLSVWKTLNNNITADDVCITKVNPTGSTEITFGMFKVIDRTGYENGALIILVPDVKSDYDGDGNVVTERYVTATANYQRERLNQSASIEKEFSGTYKDNFATVQKWFIIISVITVAAVVGLIVIKIYVKKKKEIK